MGNLKPVFRGQEHRHAVDGASESIEFCARASGNERSLSQRLADLTFAQLRQAQAAFVAQLAGQEP